MRQIIKLFGFTLLVMLAGSTLHAQNDSLHSAKKPGRILGVFDGDTGEPIADAEVMDLFVEAVARTETHGLVELSHFESRNDSVAVRVRKVGYTDTAFVVMVGLADTIPVQISLHKLAQALAVVTTNASTNTMFARQMQDMEDRRKIGLGRYLVSDELKKYQDQRITDILIEHGMTKEAGCRGSAKYLINGDPTTSPAMAALLLQDTGENIQAVEYYSPAQIPSQYGGTSAGKVCSLIILWTHRL